MPQSWAKHKSGTQNSIVTVLQMHYALAMNKIEDLIAAARKARDNAYAPNSKYKVGAAVLCENDNIVVGCNVENSQFLQIGTCAEVTCLHSARAQGFKKFNMLVVFSENGVAPCGTCREVIMDHNPEMTLILADTTGLRKTLQIKDLLPLSFVLKK